MTGNSFQLTTNETGKCVRCSYCIDCTLVRSGSGSGPESTMLGKETERMIDFDFFKRAIDHDALLRLK